MLCGVIEADKGSCLYILTIRSLRMVHLLIFKLSDDFSLGHFS